MAEPTVDELIRHLQVELEKAEDILDSKERTKRQLQIEITIQEALSFQQRHSMLDDAGIDPLKISEAVRLIQKAEKPTAKVNAEGGTRNCEKCAARLEEDLDFCPSCGTTL